MIKLGDLLKENGAEEYPPYMYSSVGFGCHVCSYLEHNEKEGNYICKNSHYQKHMGTSTIIDPETKEPVPGDQLHKYCSNWFKPKAVTV